MYVRLWMRDLGLIGLGQMSSFFNHELRIKTGIGRQVVDCDPRTGRDCSILTVCGRVGECLRLNLPNGPILRCPALVRCLMTACGKSNAD